MNNLPINRRLVIFWTAAVISLAAILLIYLNGISGGLFYDDERPLGRLADINSLFSFEAVDFVLGEISGPLGRSVAMLSFLPHYAGWPDNLSSILFVNVLIHCFNGLLVYIGTRQLLTLSTGTPAQQPRDQHQAIAGLAALLWLILPIHAATVLIAIQRMAALSATFLLLGVIVYLKGLQLQARQHPRGLDVQILALVICLPLAVLTKENGALLVLMLLIIEVTVLRQKPELQKFRAMRLAVLGLASLAIVAYLLKRFLNNPFETLFRRDFSAFERLITQPLILVDYLKQSFWPHWQAINPFQDHWRHVETWVLLSPEGLALVAILAWLLLALVVRHSWPWFAFASLWFFGSHLIESTTLGLELYFLHRNYVALVGLSILIAIMVCRAWSRQKGLTALAVVMYCGFLGINLAQVVVLWGQPDKAAVVWFETQPASGRAANYLAKPLWEQGQIAPALEVIEKNLTACPECMNSRSWALVFACKLGNNTAARTHYAALLEWSVQRSDLSSAVNNIELYHVALNEGHCTPGEDYTAYALLEQLIATRPIDANQHMMRHLWFKLGRLYMIDGDVEKGFELFHKQ